MIVLSLWKGEVENGLPEPRPFPDRIVAEVAERHGLTRKELCSADRHRPIAHARQEAMWELRRRTKLSLTQIAHRVGVKDHTSVLHGIRVHQARMCGESVD